MNHVRDASFEELPSQWVLGSDCDQSGAVISASNPKGGSRSLSITSRLFGGESTCGYAEQLLVDLKVGEAYRFGIWWDAQGVSAGRNTRVFLGGALLGQISGVTPGPGQYVRFSAPTVFIATAPTALLRLEQSQGASPSLFTRFMDLAELSEVIQGSVSADGEAGGNEGTPEAIGGSAGMEGQNPFGNPGYGG